MKIKLKVCLLFLLIIILYLANCIWRHREQFYGPVDEQSDVDMNSRCVINKTDYLSKLSDMNGQIKDTFKDNTKFDQNIIKLYKRFGILLTYLLMSDTRYKNIFGLTELQTNVKMFKVTIYKTFSNNDRINRPERFNKLSQITLSTDPSLWEVHETEYDNNNSIALKKMKKGLIEGGFEYDDDKTFKGLIQIYKEFKEMFYGYDINIDIFQRVFIEDTNLENEFKKHYFRDNTRLKDLDTHFKEVYKIFRENYETDTNENENVGDHYRLKPEDFEFFNSKIIENFPSIIPDPVWKIQDGKEQRTFSNYPSSITCDHEDLEKKQNPKHKCENIKYDIRRVQGYYWLRTEIEKWKQFKDDESLSKNQRDIARRILDYLDKGSNNRKEIFKKMVKAYFYGEERNIFSKWDDNDDGNYGTLEHPVYGENYGRYGNMKRMKDNLHNYEHIVDKVMEPYIIPNSTNLEMIRTILVPDTSKCELPKSPI
jgi:hypothetical protein